MMLKFLLLFVLGLSFQLNSSAVMESNASKVDVKFYERLFQTLGVNKALTRLEDGGQILISRIWVGEKIKRPKLVVQYTDNMGKEHPIDSLWLQPSLVFFMKDDQVLLKWHRDALFAFGLPEALIEKEL